MSTSIVPSADVLSVNISSVKDLVSCPLRWYIKWVMNRVPRIEPLALSFGKITHKVFDAHIADGLTMAEACASLIKQGEDSAVLLRMDGDDVAADNIMAAVNALREYEEVLPFWEDKFKIDATLEVETPFEYPHPADPSVLIKGRPDRVVSSMGRILHMQNRTIAAGKNIQLYTETMKLDMHELIYAWAIRMKYQDTGLPYGGTIFNLMRKLKYRGKPTKACPEGVILNEPSKIFSQYLMSVDDKQIEVALDDLLWYANYMRRLIADGKNGILPPHNRSLNAGPFGNSKDIFFDVFIGKINIMDNDYFTNREDTYEAAAVVEE